MGDTAIIKVFFLKRAAKQLYIRIYRYTFCAKEYLHSKLNNPIIYFERCRIILQTLELIGNFATQKNPPQFPKAGF